MYLVFHNVFVLIIQDVQLHVACSFIQSADMIQQLIDSVEHTMRHALEAEEDVPLEQVTDFDEVFVMCDRTLAR